MSNLTESLVTKAKKAQKVDVKELAGNTLIYKKSKFKTFSGKFKYENRREYLKSLLSLATNGYPLSY
tara:strand:+ start:645 stop:845 length:201 start_codon:yes stop_codon:yes gene_type:complete